MAIILESRSLPEAVLPTFHHPADQAAEHEPGTFQDVDEYHSVVSAVIIAREVGRQTGQGRAEEQESSAGEKRCAKNRKPACALAWERSAKERDQEGQNGQGLEEVAKR
ncbi:hypothetical protein [Microbispora sp. NPDC049125]|uniref:hypothetical protein n=1 Tax=Microbispora sp. NPDC049125 TaxID=3154929 RepID=UPI0034671432